MGLKHKNTRPIDGIFLLDKAEGLSSNQALQRCKRIFQADKAGHTGSLDPMATGMLPICFGRATRLCEYLLEADKTYEATLTLGKATETGDKTGAVIESAPVPILTQDSLENALQQWKGSISQIPPMYSALKHQGRCLYQLARKGVEVERTPRQVEIYALSLTHFSDHALTFQVHCSKGTYIRTLAEDLAKTLGTCGHLSQLRRLTCAGFSPLAMKPIEALKGEMSELISINEVLQHLPRVDISQELFHLTFTGRPISLPSSIDGQVRLFCQDELVAIANVSAGQLIERKFI